MSGTTVYIEHLGYVIEGVVLRETKRRVRVGFRFGFSTKRKWVHRKHLLTEEHREAAKRLRVG